MPRDHRKLDVFQRSDRLVEDVYRATRGMPIEERFGLLAQIRRAAVSVATNIVEGCARVSEAEYFRFLHIARASARECAYLIGLSARLEIIDSTSATSFESRYDQLQAMLFALVNALENPS